MSEVKCIPSKRIKTLHHHEGQTEPLKEFARRLIAAKDPIAQQWLDNKSRRS